LITFDTKVIEIIKRSPDVKSFRFELKESMDFKPGQFLSVTITIDGKEKTKYFSFSNSPTEKGYVEFTKRITASPFSQALDALKAGNRASLKMSMGSFTFEGEYDKIALLSGGIGITPIRSICKFATDKKLSSDMVLLYGNRREEDIIFRRDFDEMAALNKNFRAIYTLTSPDIDKNAWQGRMGHIDEEMIKKELPDYAERIFYICGPPGMVGTLSSILRTDLKLPDSRIKVENFTGY